MRFSSFGIVFIEVIIFTITYRAKKSGKFFSQIGIDDLKCFFLAFMH